MTSGAADGVDPDSDDVNQGHSTVLQTRFDPSPGPSAFVVVVAQGPDAGKRFELDGSQPCRVLIGQSESCEVRLADRSVSRRHAALDVQGNRIRVNDLGSKNGTYADGVALVDGFVTDGATLRVGATVLTVHIRDAEPVALPPLATFGRVIGASTEMRRLYRLCEKLANSDVPVIIEGETGTGKELLAESLHEAGPRKNGPFVVFDCTAVPSNLLESELFGHERGAFTGAVAARRGVFDQANGGTLLIDEIGDLELALQPKLLRAIERREVRPIGSNRSLHVDVRVLAATRRDLDREVAAGRFRDDLFHRLAVARIELPPLHARRGDVALLVRHFCRELDGDERFMTRDLLRRWEDHHWPGNVRELRNTVARHLALGELASMGEGLRPEPRSDAPAPGRLEGILEEALDLPLGEARARVVQEFERRYIARMLARHDGNVTRAAETAGVARRYFQVLKARSPR